VDCRSRREEKVRVTIASEPGASAPDASSFRLGWEAAIATAAKAMCARCAVPYYSRPKYLRPTQRRQRMHLLLGRPRIFKDCMASAIWNLRPPPV